MMQRHCSKGAIRITYNPCDSAITALQAMAAVEQQPCRQPQLATNVHACTASPNINPKLVESNVYRTKGEAHLLSFSCIHCLYVQNCFVASCLWFGIATRLCNEKRVCSHWGFPHCACGPTHLLFCIVCRQRVALASHPSNTHRAATIFVPKLVMVLIW